MRTPLPGKRIGVHPAPIPDVPSSVNSGVGIQYLFVPALTRCSYSISVSGNRCCVHRKKQRGTRPSFTRKGKNTVVGIVKIDPLKAGITIVVLRGGRFARVEEIKILDQPFQTFVQRVLEQVPIDTLIVIPFFPLTDITSHE